MENSGFFLEGLGLILCRYEQAVWLPYLYSMCFSLKTLLTYDLLLTDLKQHLSV